MEVLSNLWKLGAALGVLFVMSVPPAQETHPSTPGLTSAEYRSDSSPEDVMRRAAEAFKVAGLIAHKPLPLTAGASNEWVFALINCERVDGKTRVIVTVASNSARRGEAPRMCHWLTEYMKSGKAPADAPFRNVTGVWEYSWVGHQRDQHTHLLNLNADGTVTSKEPGWGATIWWTDGAKVYVKPPTAFPKENLHYSIVMTLSSDGKSMASEVGNYFVASSRARRVGDLPASGGGETPAATGGPTTPADAADTHLDFAFTLPPAPLPLPPPGALAAKTAPEVPWSDDQEPKFTIEMRSVTAAHIPDPAGPDEYDGSVQITVTLSEEGEQYRVYVVAGGYLTPAIVGPHGGTKRTGGILGTTYDGNQPAYKAFTLHSSTDSNSPKPGFIRRVVFDMPRVLPAVFRAELYHVGSRGLTTLVASKEVSFTMPWPDRRAMGSINGKAENKITSVVGSFLDSTSLDISIPTTESRTKDLIHLSVAAKPGESKSRRVYDMALTGKERWKEVEVWVHPSFQDLDHRNNHFYPGLPNGGYVDTPPIPYLSSGKD